MSRFSSAYEGEQPLSGRYDAADASWEAAKSGYASRVLAEALASAKTGDGFCDILGAGLSSPHWVCVTNCPLWQFIPGLEAKAVKCAETSAQVFEEARFWEAYCKAYPDCAWGEAVASGVAVRDLPGYTRKSGAAWGEQVDLAREQFAAGKKIAKPGSREVLPDSRFATLAGLRF